MSKDEKQSDQIPPSTMPVFLPCLSYALHTIDTGMDSSRDEGEPRLRRLRPLLRVSARTPGLEKLLDCSHKSSLARMLAPRLRDDPSDWLLAELNALQDSLLSPQHDSKPSIALLTPTVRTLSIAEADSLDEQSTHDCVPIKYEKMVAMPSSAPLKTPKPVIVVRWPINVFKLIKGGTRRPALIIEYVGPGRVRFSVNSADGTKTENVYAGDHIPQHIIEQLFQSSTDAPESSFGVPALRLPCCKEDLPELLQLQLAGFAQNRLRAHVLTAASGPLTTARPLWFENFKLTWKVPGKNTTSKRPGMCIKAFFHPASATCFCGAHVLQPVQQRHPNVKFTGKDSAVMTLDICGHCLSPDSEDVGCPTHGTKCVRNSEFAPNICCSNASVSFSCNHENAGEWKPYGTWLPTGTLSTFDWQELSMLLAMCADYNHKATPLFAEPASEIRDRKLQALVEQVTTELNRRVSRFDLHSLKDKVRPSDGDLMKLDMLALQCLREGGMAQAKLHGTQRAPKLHREHGPELTTDEKKLAKTHHWLFPRHGQPYGRRVLGDTVSLASLAGRSDQSPSSEVHDEPPQLVKRQRTHDPNYEYEDMTEYMDPKGMAEFKRQLDVLMSNTELPQRHKDRGQHFQQYFAVCDNEYGDEVDGPLGFPARPLVCKYRARNDGGRLYPTGMPKAPGWHKGEARSVCIQAAPREMRPFLCGRWAHDFDMVNAQPEMLRQLPGRLSWVDNRIAPVLPEMERWCADRPEYIAHVADFHRLPADAERHYEYRKDIVKELMIRLMFGGQYNSWIKDVCTEFGRQHANEPRSPRVVALASELAQLRKDVFESRQWCGFVEKDSARLWKEGKKHNQEAVDRSVFARIAQRTENEVLTVMRTFLKEQGWTVLTLCFDGVRLTTHRDCIIAADSVLDSRPCSSWSCTDQSACSIWLV